MRSRGLMLLFVGVVAGLLMAQIGGVMAQSGFGMMGSDTMRGNMMNGTMMSHMHEAMNGNMDYDTMMQMHALMHDGEELAGHTPANCPLLPSDGAPN